jgi:hypothetical protein
VLSVGSGIVIPRAKFEGRPELLKLLDDPVGQR